LIGGQLLLADQFLGQLLGIVRFLIRRQTVDQRSNLIGGHQTAVGKVMHELVDRDRHDKFP